MGVAHEEVDRIKQQVAHEEQQRTEAVLAEQQREHEAKEALDQQMAEVKKGIRAERDDMIRARHRLKELQSKMVVGGESLLDREEAHQAEQRRLEEEAEEQVAAHTHCIGGGWALTLLCSLPLCWPCR